MCPVCKKKLEHLEKVYRCPQGHSFDIAAQGYVNLNMHKSRHTGDNPQMIKARRDFLAKDHYRFLKDKVNELLEKDDVLVDLACGEGYYTKDFKCNDKTGIDLSRSGLKAAAKSDKTTSYILSSIFRTPLADESADKVTTIFAPIADKEILRILKKDGEFILVRPDERHLFELKEKIYEHPYLNEVKDIELPGLKHVRQIAIESQSILDHKEIADLFMMTPYYNTTSPEDKEKAFSLDELKVSFCFIIDVYGKI